MTTGTRGTFYKVSYPFLMMGLSICITAFSAICIRSPDPDPHLLTDVLFLCGGSASLLVFFVALISALLSPSDLPRRRHDLDGRRSFLIRVLKLVAVALVGLVFVASMVVLGFGIGLDRSVWTNRVYKRPDLYRTFGRARSMMACLVVLSGVLASITVLSCRGWRNHLLHAWRAQSSRQSKDTLLPIAYSNRTSTAQSSTSTLTTLTKTSPHLHPQPLKKQRGFRMESQPPPPPNMNKALPAMTSKVSAGPALRAMWSVSSLRSWCSGSSSSTSSFGPPPEIPPKSVLRPGPVQQTHHLRYPSQERPASTRPSIRWSSGHASLASSRRSSGPCPVDPLPRLPEDIIPPVPPVPRLPSSSRFEPDGEKATAVAASRLRPRTSRTVREKDLYRSALVRRASSTSNVSFAVPSASHGRTVSVTSKLSAPPKSILKKSTSDASFRTAHSRVSEKRMRRKPSTLSIASSLDEVPELELIGIDDGAYIVNVKEAIDKTGRTDAFDEKREWHEYQPPALQVRCGVPAHGQGLGLRV